MSKKDIVGFKDDDDERWQMTIKNGLVVDLARKQEDVVPREPRKRKKK